MVSAVADGLGGHEAGEVAAAYVVGRLARMAPPSLQSPEEIALALRAMSTELAAAGDDHPEQRDMGTTVVGLSLSPEQVIWFNIGDSRAYKLADGYLGQMSVDDTPTALLAEPGESPEPTSVVTQSIGPATPAPAAHTGIEPGMAEGTYLLCSDGLSNLVEATEIERLLARHAHDDPTAVKALWAAAMNAGGRDNITVVLVRRPTMCAMPQKAWMVRLPGRVQSADSANPAAIRHASEVPQWVRDGRVSKSGPRKVPRNLTPDFATFSWTGQAPPIPQLLRPDMSV